MDSTLAGLIQGCAEALEDNAPRLILADWLEDHGQAERAELVRVQCRLADWVPDWQERQALIDRQDELIAAHRDTWLGPLAGLCESVEFVRGLCHLRIRGPALGSPEFGVAFGAVAETALVERVRLTQAKSLKRLAGRSWLGQVPALALDGLAVSDGVLEPLLTGTAAGRVVDLDLSNNEITSNGLVYLMRSELGQGLTCLALRNNNVQGTLLRFLVSTNLPRLRELDLACNTLHPDLHRELAAWHAARGTSLRRKANSLGMEFMRIPAGSFLMGAIPAEKGAQDDELPQHAVTLTRPFWLGRFAVTQAEHREVMGTHRSHFQGDWLPVDSVGPVEALEFCRRLGELPAEKAAGRTYRLPTEAEWEHACRAGTFTSFHTGDTPSLDAINFSGVWDPEHAPRTRWNSTRPVGTYPPNAFGLCEMHGNVWEPCSDWHADDWYEESPAVDPVGPKSGVMHARRGGCWAAIGSYCRAAKRHGAGPESGGQSYHGIRVVLVTAE
jgi:uncharacterized protein (TIGR02996 family)